MIPQHIIEQVIESASIVDVIGKYVKLDKKGVNHIGSCPFHDEKTSSFTVSPAKQIFKCFGCGKGGNVVSFLMNHENKSYIEVIKDLASDAGIAIPERKVSEEEKKKYDYQQEIYKANAFAWEFFKDSYEKNDQAKKYYTERFPSSLNVKFVVGYASATLQSAAKAANISPEILLAAGLIKKNDRGLYDTFIQRIVWPVYSIDGRIAGFTGRVIEKDSKYAKYLNTCDTIVFNKGNLLYNLFEVKNIIKQTKHCTIVEGTTDVQRMQLEGYNDVVAPLGTSLTEFHAKLISRWAKRATIITDGDDAGEKSTERTGLLLLSENMFVSIVRLPDGEDPDSFFNENPAAKEYVKTNTQDYVIWMAQKLFAEVGIDTGRKIEAVEQLAELLTSIVNDSTRQTYVDELVKNLKKYGVQKSTITSALRGLIKTQEEEENLTVDGESLPTYLTDKDKRDYFKYGFYEGLKGNDLNQYFFGPGKRASNFVIRPIFHIEDAMMPRKLFELVNKYGFSKKIDIDMQEMTSLQAFRRVVEGQGNFIFEGNEADFMRIRAKLYDNTVFCKPVDTLGWQKEGFWAWANGIQTEAEFTQADDDGVVMHKSINYYIPAFSQIYLNDKTLFFDERKFKLIPQQISIKAWSGLFTDVFGVNGQVGIAFWVAATFRDYILQIFKNFPILNLFGPKGTGKSQMAMSLACLYGEQQTAFNIHNGTKAGLADHLSRFRDALAWIDEYKNSLDFDKIEAMKSIYDSIGRSRMNMDKGKRKETTEVNSAAIVSGQEMPTADIALFSRVIFVRFTKSEFSNEEKDMYQKLKDVERKGLSSYTNELIKNRSYFESEFYYYYNETLQDFLKAVDEEQIEDRVMRNWVSIAAAFRTIANKISFSFNYEDLKKTSIEAMKIQNAQTSKSDEIGIFWSLMEAMYDQDIIIKDWDFKVTYITKIITNKGVREFAQPKNVLMFKFNTVAKHYGEQLRRQGNKPLPTDTLRYYLENHKFFLGVAKSEYWKMENFDQAKREVIKRTARNTAYCFDYDRMEINLDREHEPMMPNHNHTNEPAHADQHIEPSKEDLPF
jgi:DNA primase